MQHLQDLKVELELAVSCLQSEGSAMNLYSSLTEEKLEASHHIWLRKILHISSFSWKEKISSEKVWECTQQ